MIAVTYQLTTTTYGVNFKRLDLEADTYQHRILTKVPSDKTMIKKSLCFLTDEEKLNQEYTNSEKFITFYNEANKEISDKEFLNFSSSCKEIFEESNDRYKVSAYMLLERVKNKILTQMMSLKKLEDITKQYEYDTKTNTSDTNEILNYFSNIDKNIKK